MDEGSWNESSPRVHPGYYTMFTSGEGKYQHPVVNNGERRKSYEFISTHSDDIRGSCAQTTSATKDGVSAAKQSDGGIQIIAVIVVRFSVYDLIRVVNSAVRSTRCNLNP